MHSAADEKGPSLQRLRTEAIALLQEQKTFSEASKQHIADLAKALNEHNEEKLIQDKRRQLLGLLNQENNLETYYILMMLAKYWPLSRKCPITHEDPPQNLIMTSHGHHYDLPSLYVWSIKGQDPHRNPLSICDLEYIKSEATRQGIAADPAVNRVRNNVGITIPPLTVRNVSGTIGGLAAFAFACLHRLPELLTWKTSSLALGVKISTTLGVVGSAICFIPSGIMLGVLLGSMIYHCYKYCKSNTVPRPEPEPEFTRDMNRLFEKVEQNARVEKPDLEKRLTSTAASLKQLQVAAPVVDAKGAMPQTKEKPEARREKHAAAVTKRLGALKSAAAIPVPAATPVATATPTAAPYLSNS